MGEEGSVGSWTFHNLFYYLYLRSIKLQNFKNPFQINYELSHLTHNLSGVNQMKWGGLAHFDQLWLCVKNTTIESVHLLLFKCNT